MQVEGLAQGDVEGLGGRVGRGERGVQGAFKAGAIAADGGEDGRVDLQGGRPVGGGAGHAREALPHDRRAQGGHDLLHRVRHLRADAVARDEGDGAVAGGADVGDVGHDGAGLGGEGLGWDGGGGSGRERVEREGSKARARVP